MVIENDLPENRWRRAYPKNKENKFFPDGTIDGEPVDDTLRIHAHRGIEVPDDETGEMTKPRAAPRRKHWALQALEANREGDTEKLRDAMVRERNGEKIADVNQRTSRGGYHGYRFMTWGKHYGGLPDGETLLHLCVRPDNSKFPNRLEIAQELVRLGVDPSIRSERAMRNAEGEEIGEHPQGGRTARDINQVQVDWVYPVHKWKVHDVQVWLEGLGPWMGPRWLNLFREKHVDGVFLIDLARPNKEIDASIDDNLIRLGFPTDDHVEDREAMVQALRQLNNELWKTFHAKQDRQRQLEGEAAAKRRVAKLLATMRGEGETLDDEKDGESHTDGDGCDAADEGKEEKEERGEKGERGEEVGVENGEVKIDNDDSPVDHDHPSDAGDDDELAHVDETASFEQTDVEIEAADAADAEEK